MIYGEINHECIYGITKEGIEITETFFSDDNNSPVYKKNNTTTIGIPLDYLDERKRLARIYKYCPLCGKKLNKNTIKKLNK